MRSIPGWSKRWGIAPQILKSILFQLKIFDNFRSEREAQQNQKKETELVTKSKRWVFWRICLCFPSYHRKKVKFWFKNNLWYSTCWRLRLRDFRWNLCVSKFECVTVRVNWNILQIRFEVRFCFVKCKFESCDTVQALVHPHSWTTKNVHEFFWVRSSSWNTFRFQIVLASGVVNFRKVITFWWENTANLYKFERIWPKIENLWRKIDLRTYGRT